MKTNKNYQRPSSQNSNQKHSKRHQVAQKIIQKVDQIRNKSSSTEKVANNTQNPQGLNNQTANKEFINAQNHKIRQKLNELDLQKIFQHNKQYFMEKVSINEIPKPGTHSFKMPSRIGKSEYSKQFHKNVKHFNTGNIERQDNLNNSKVDVSGYKTTYKTNYQNQKVVEGNKRTNQVQRDIKQLLKKKQQTTFVPQQGPTFMQSSYAFNYGSKKAVPVESAKRKQSKLMGGGTFKGQTSYGNNFKGLNSKTQKPIRHANNKLFMSLVIPKQTAYNKEFNRTQKNRRQKTIQVVQSCKPKHQSVSKGRNMRIHTQYQNSFSSTPKIQSSKANSSKKISCLNAQQLKQFILNL